MENKKKQPLSETDVAYQILREQKSPMHYKELIAAVLDRMGVVPENRGLKMAQIHTEINLDSRFSFLGKGMWGLHIWSSMTAKMDDTLDPKERNYQPKLSDYIWDEEEDEDDEEEEEDPADSFLIEDEEEEEAIDDELIPADEDDDMLDLDIDEIDDIDDMDEDTAADEDEDEDPEGMLRRGQ